MPRVKGRRTGVSITRDGLVADRGADRIRCVVDVRKMAALLSRGKERRSKKNFGQGEERGMPRHRNLLLFTPQNPLRRRIKCKGDAAFLP